MTAKIKTVIRLYASKSDFVHGGLVNGEGRTWSSATAATQIICYIGDLNQSTKSVMHMAAEIPQKLVAIQEIQI